VIRRVHFAFRADAEGFASGPSAQCPDDTVEASMVVCREVAGECDVVEHCEGSAKA
jgi:hypothetical protein